MILTPTRASGRGTEFGLQVRSTLSSSWQLQLAVDGMTRSAPANCQLHTSRLACSSTSRAPANAPTSPSSPPPALPSSQPSVEVARAIERRGHRVTLADEHRRTIAAISPAPTTSARRVSIASSAPPSTTRSSSPAAATARCASSTGIDYDAIRDNPRPVVGFSDVTASIRRWPSGRRRQLPRADAQPRLLRTGSRRHRELVLVDARAATRRSCATAHDRRRGHRGRAPRACSSAVASRSRTRSIGTPYDFWIDGRNLVLGRRRRAGLSHRPYVDPPTAVWQNAEQSEGVIIGSVEGVRGRARKCSRLLHEFFGPAESRSCATFPSVITETTS